MIEQPVYENGIWKNSYLESTPATPIPFVIHDLVSTFYDESVQLGERKHLLKACTMHLERLAGGRAEW